MKMESGQRKAINETCLPAKESLYLSLMHKHVNSKEYIEVDIYKIGILK